MSKLLRPSQVLTLFPTVSMGQLADWQTQGKLVPTNTGGGKHRRFKLEDIEGLTGVKLPPEEAKPKKRLATAQPVTFGFGNVAYLSPYQTV
jgi:hypothetical protein